MLGHPRGLAVLFFTEMWERFSYYGMRALLVLYLMSQMDLERAAALEIYGIFTAAAYFTNLPGGLFADKILGQRKAIFIGGLLIALGQFCLAISPDWLNLGLGLIASGTGFLKPNVSSIVGSMYTQNDPRRDGGFTIFYMGINLGAFLAPLICGTLGEKVSWSYGFLAAGIGMLLGLVIFYFGSSMLGKEGLPPKSKSENLESKDYLDILLYTLGTVAVVFGFLKFWEFLPLSIRDTLVYSVIFAAIVALIYVIVTNTKGSDEWGRVFVIMVLLFFNVFFWAGFEQAGGTFNLFASEKTDRLIGTWEIPASYFQSINAMFIFTVAPLFSLMWVFLNKMGKEPATPYKFGIALLLLGLGFVVMALGNDASESIKVSPFWLVAVYFLHTMGELCLSPIGLSMITKLSPPKIVSFMMGMWFTSIATAQYIAGVLESILHRFEMPLFYFLAVSSGIASLALLVLSPLLKKLMKGIY